MGFINAWEEKELQLPEIYVHVLWVGDVHVHGHVPFFDD